jgi:hypothetical protein
MKRKIKSSLKVFAVIGTIVLLAVCISLSNSYAAKTNSNPSGSNTENSLSGNSVSPNPSSNSKNNISELNPIDAIKSMASSLGLSKLHNPPFSSDTPKIQVYLSGTSYSIEVISGKVSVKQSEIQNPDLIIRTNMEEAVKMYSNKGYIKESFTSGKSGVEIVAGKVTLLLKGYDKVYSAIA